MTESKDSNMYFNLKFPGPVDNMWTPAQVELQFTDTLLNSPKEYNLSILRFELPSSTIPISLFNTDPSAYVLTLRYNNMDFSANLVYIPDNFSGIEIYKQPIYSYQVWCDMINNAFQHADASMGAMFPAKPSTKAPYFVFDRLNGLFTLIVEKVYNTAPIEIYFNTMLYNLFLGSMRAEYYGKSGLKDYKIVVGDFKNNSFSSTEYNITQEFNTLYNFNVFKKLIITSDLPVVKEYIPSKNTSQNELNSINILSDLVPYSENDSRYFRSTIFYLPSAEFRRIKMTGNQSLTKMSVKVYWTDDKENIYEWYLAKGQTGSMKILFEPINKKV